MSKDVRYALLTDNRHAQPRPFDDIDALARHIQTERGEMAIDLVPVEDLEIIGDAEDRPGVSIFTQFEDGSRDRLIGHAWMGDLTVEHLKAALRRNRLVINPEPSSRINRRGFASLSKERRTEIARRGGAAVPADRRSFAQDRDLAKSAGSKGGKVSTGKVSTGPVSTGKAPTASASERPA